MLLPILAGVVTQVSISTPGDILPIRSRLSQGTWDWTTASLVSRRLGEPTSKSQGSYGVEWWTYEGKGAKYRIRWDLDSKRPVLPGGSICDMVVLFKPGSGSIGDLKVGDPLPSKSTLGAPVEPSSTSTGDDSNYHFADGRVQVWLDTQMKVDRIALHAYDLESKLPADTYKPKQYSWNGLSVEPNRTLTGLEQAVFEGLESRVGALTSDGVTRLFPGVRLVSAKQGESVPLYVAFSSASIKQVAQATIQRDTKDPMSHYCRTDFALETNLIVTHLDPAGKTSWIRGYAVKDQIIDTVETKVKQKIEYSSEQIESIVRKGVLQRPADILDGAKDELVGSLGFLRVIDADVSQGVFTVPASGLTVGQQIDLVVSPGFSLRYDPEASIHIAGGERLEKGYVESISGGQARCRLGRSGINFLGPSVSKAENAYARFLNPRSGIVYAIPTARMFP